MKNLVWTIIIYSFIVLMVSSCSLQSEEKLMNKVKDITKSTFEQDQQDISRQKLNHLSLYIPEDFNIVEETNSNIVFVQGKQTFILFYNPLENSLSDLNYQAAAQMNDHALLESFTDSNRFGYVSIVAEDESKYELQVGIGGMKVTTVTSKKNLLRDAEMMMNIANSVNYKTIK